MAVLFYKISNRSLNSLMIVYILIIRWEMLKILLFNLLKNIVNVNTPINIKLKFVFANESNKLPFVLSKNCKYPNIATV